jgi:glycerophosphoryl diester phosphodiesterase
MSAALIVIAHRGASGYLPEHTLKQSSRIRSRADYLEQDVVATATHNS